MVEAKYYIKKERGYVQCLLCPKNCVIADGKKGFCYIRENRGGTLYATHYGVCAAVHLDPIEKKPLYHFYPGTQILSIGTSGCNLRCKFCQNWHMIEGKIATQEVSIESLIDAGKRYNSVGIAFTYNEPLIWYEFVLDTAKVFRREGLKNVLVTNGLINPEPLEELLPWIDAMNIDLKSSRDDFYKTYCDGRVEKVKETIKRCATACHIEITNLIITSCNDSQKEIEEIIEFVSSIDKNIPLHFSRYFPHYKFTYPPTPLDKLYLAYELAKKSLNFVYLGNVWDDKTSTTFCPSCKSACVVRRGYHIELKQVKNGKCSVCGFDLNMKI